MQKGNRVVRFVLIVSLALAAFLPFWCRSPAASRPTNEACLKCHGNRLILSLTNKQRSKIVITAPEIGKVQEGKRDLYVDERQFRASAHGTLSCTDCHVDITDIPHAQRPAKVSCTRCHQEIADDYAKEMQATGGIRDCTECHDPHATRSCKNNVAQQPSGICLPYHKDVGHRGPLAVTRGNPWLDGIGIAAVLASLVFVGMHILVRLITRRTRRH
jgi:predicted CXXCH cytochrome family protein